MWKKAQQQRETRIKAAPSDGAKAKLMGRDLAANREVAAKLFAHLNKQRCALLNPNRWHLHKPVKVSKTVGPSTMKP